MRGILVAFPTPSMATAVLNKNEFLNLGFFSFKMGKRPAWQNYEHTGKVWCKWLL